MSNGGVFFPMRVFFKKEGRIKYISHLDMNRCVTRALKRSALPVWHTLGFNPHIYVTFALPLSLGYESNCETFDFRLTEQLDSEEIVRRLNEVFPEGVVALQACEPVQKSESITWADYDISLEFTQAAVICEKLEQWLAQPEIRVKKRSKKGMREVNVTDNFSTRSLRHEGGMIQLNLRAAAGATFNLNPTLLLDAFAQETGCKPEWTRIVRRAILNESMQNFV